VRSFVGVKIAMDDMSFRRGNRPDKSCPSSVTYEDGHWRIQFPTTPPDGYSFTLNGQRLEKVADRQDGSTLFWQTECQICGDPFITGTSAAPGAHSIRKLCRTHAHQEWLSKTFDTPAEALAVATAPYMKPKGHA